MHIPTTLKHKPVLVAEDYGRIDGRTAYGSDAQGLSLGLAQWNDRGKVDISAKVWRHTGEKWSRQSEELPLHRVLDLAILACRAQLYFQEEAYRFPRGYDPEHPQVDRIGLQGDAMTVEVCTSSDHIDEDLRLFQDALARDGELLGERMRVLARLLGEQPDLLLLDEPSMGLAPILVEQIFEIIQNLHKAGTTILLVEQNAQAALSVADRGYVLETGKIVTTGTGTELLASPAIKKAYLGG